MWPSLDMYKLVSPKLPNIGTILEATVGAHWFNSHFQPLCDMCDMCYTFMRLSSPTHQLTASLPFLHVSTTTQ